ncbi:hypothetical protein LX99_00805 [Mucilaginibacter oryzae]|uniref:Uncharacterized protein n=1 Tax=Mucilaginibacter oryzae TaxID=468058 RepID=A0A316HJX8_9SPHI|nr:hypothetical protein [Mucilaginibacter oryzae]PWK80340.1 hypothetical protein LX99_00805 [Mucilaginibacter oryzae]
MIYLSAQPDEYYFIWQLQLQLFNFVQLGIPRENIHILIGYDHKRGLSKDFQALIDEHPDVNIHAYSDTRKSKAYIPSIRPHIIAKHFLAFPELQHEALFYHDSDILFSSLPDFRALNEDEKWYCSDTRGYLSAEYIKSTIGIAVFCDACAAVGVTPAMIEFHDDNAGGAQYLMKKVSVLFWEKVERDCADIFSIFEGSNDSIGFCNRQNDNRIQSWCADMWAIWWNAIFFGISFEISKELDFSWAGSPIREWQSKKILHYTGSAEKGDKTIFRKNNYIRYSPFHDDFSGISKQNCSFPLIKLIEEFNQAQQHKRCDLTDVTFVFVTRIQSDVHLENLLTVIKHLTLTYITNMIVIEADEKQMISPEAFSEKIDYRFFYDENPEFHLTRYNNLAVARANTEFIVLCDNACALLPDKQIMQGISILRSENISIVSPYEGYLLNVDILLKMLFMYSQDLALLEENINKLKTISRRSYAGMIMVKKEDFLFSGGDNENIVSPGPQVLERIKRMQILGFNLKRIPGNLYWLSTNTKEGHTPQADDASMLEYLKICSFTRNELVEYIETWPQ